MIMKLINTQKLNHLKKITQSAIEFSETKKNENPDIITIYNQGEKRLKVILEIANQKHQPNYNKPESTSIGQYAIKVAREYDPEYSKILCRVAFAYDECFRPEFIAEIQKLSRKG